MVSFSVFGNVAGQNWSERTSLYLAIWLWIISEMCSDWTFNGSSGNLLGVVGIDGLLSVVCLPINKSVISGIYINRDFIELGLGYVLDILERLELEDENWGGTERGRGKLCEDGAEISAIVAKIRGVETEVVILKGYWLGLRVSYRWTSMPVFLHYQLLCNEARIRWW